MKFILMTVPPQRKEDSRARFPNTEGGSPTIAWCAHSSSFVSTLGIQGKPRRVQAIREEESTKRAEKGSLLAVCPEHCGSATLGFSDGQLVLKGCTTMVVTQKPFLTGEPTKQQRSLEAFKASVHSMHTHKQADRGH